MEVSDLEERARTNRLADMVDMMETESSHKIRPDGSLKAAFSQISHPSAAICDELFRLEAPSRLSHYGKQQSREVMKNAISDEHIQSQH